MNIHKLRLELLEMAIASTDAERAVAVASKWESYILEGMPFRIISEAEHQVEQHDAVVAMRGRGVIHPTDATEEAKTLRMMRGGTADGGG